MTTLDVWLEPESWGGDLRPHTSLKLVVLVRGVVPAASNSAV
jgi:hypothetical protein